MIFLSNYHNLSVCLSVYLCLCTSKIGRLDDYFSLFSQWTCQTPGGHLPFWPSQLEIQPPNPMGHVRSPRCSWQSWGMSLRSGPVTRQEVKYLWNHKRNVSFSIIFSVEKPLDSWRDIHFLSHISDSRWHLQVEDCVIGVPSYYSDVHRQDDSVTTRGFNSGSRFRQCYGG